MYYSTVIIINIHRRHWKRQKQQESPLALSTTKEDFPSYEIIPEKILPNTDDEHYETITKKLVPTTVKKVNPLYESMLEKVVSSKSSICE